MTTTEYTVVFLCRNNYIYITSQFVNNCRTSQLQRYSPTLTGAVRTRSDRLGAVDVFAAMSSRLRHSSRLRRSYRSPSLVLPSRSVESRRAGVEVQARLDTT